MGQLFCLAFHAAYRCQHSGACCTSAWPIPVEAPLRARLDAALADGRLQLAGGSAPPFDDATQPAPGIAGVLRSDATGGCAAYERDRRRCAIHRQLGEEYLPSSCRHFPRVCLIDEGAAFVTLSHYCPTAASLLFRDDLPIAIVEAPPGFARGPIEGLDARGALPPLLHPGVLADRETYREWERFVVTSLASARTAEAALARVVAVTERVRRWRPADGPLPDALRRAVEEDGDGWARAGEAPRCDWLSLDALVRGAVPAEWAPSPAGRDAADAFERWVDAAWAGAAGPVRRYLAARAFANWCSYQGRGLRTVVYSLLASLGVLRVEAARHCAAARRELDDSLLKDAFRSTDLILQHLASREELARRLSGIEDRPRREVTQFS